MDIQATIRTKFRPSKDKDTRHLDPALKELAEDDAVCNSRIELILTALLDFKSGLLEFVIASPGRISSEGPHFV